MMALVRRVITGNDIILINQKARQTIWWIKQ